jgi:hypothetical protein
MGYTPAELLWSIPCLLLVLFTFGCASKGDGEARLISAGTQTFSVNGINNCNTNSGKGSTFVYTIPYTVPAGVTVDRLRIKSTVSNGESREAVNRVFTDDGSTIGWADCFRFGSQDWVEHDVRLESTSGAVSNQTKVRVNRPSGAQ